MTKRLMMAVSLLVVLLWASGASAECAWVLWGLSPTGNYFPGEGYRSLEQCQEQANARQKQEYRRKEEGKTDMFFVLVCLPDTIDPRGRGEK